MQIRQCVVFGGDDATIDVIDVDMGRADIAGDTSFDLFVTHVHDPGRDLRLEPGYQPVDRASCNVIDIRENQEQNPGRGRQAPAGSHDLHDLRGSSANAHRRVDAVGVLVHGSNVACVSRAAVLSGRVTVVADSQQAELEHVEHLVDQCCFLSAVALCAHRDAAVHLLGETLAQLGVPGNEIDQTLCEAASIAKVDGPRNKKSVRLQQLLAQSVGVAQVAVRIEVLGERKVRDLDTFLRGGPKGGSQCDLRVAQSPLAVEFGEVAIDLQKGLSFATPGEKKVLQVQFRFFFQQLQQAGLVRPGCELVDEAPTAASPACIAQTRRDSE